MQVQNQPSDSQFIRLWRDRSPDFSVTSDHLIVTNDFHVDNGVNLRVSSFNLGNKFHSKQKCAQKDELGQGLYANNPENIDENIVQYVARKEQQIKDILQHLTTENVDALFLQEIDLFTNRKFSHKANEFQEKLQSAGYNLVMTSPGMNAKPQAIIYKKDTLTLSPNSLSAQIPGNSVGGVTHKKTLFEGLFTHNQSQQKVCLASVHLDYQGDYSNVLLNYSKARAEQGYLCIWGGDTNHAPGCDIEGLIGDYTYATNYDEDANGSGHTTQHPKSSKQKAYDGFGCCAPGDLVVRITERTKHFFAVVNRVIRVFERNSKHIHHESLPGQPWKKRRNIQAKFQDKQNLVLDDLGYKNKIMDSLSTNFLVGENVNEYIRKSISKCQSTNEMRQFLKDKFGRDESNLPPRAVELLKEAEQLIYDSEPAVLEERLHAMQEQSTAESASVKRKDIPRSQLTHNLKQQYWQTEATQSSTFFASNKDDSTPLSKKKDFIDFKSSLLEIASQDNCLKSYFLTVYKIFDAIYGRHYFPEDDRVDVLAAHKIDKSEQEVFYKGYLDVLILPLLAREMVVRTAVKTMDETDKNLKNITVFQALRVIAVALVVLPIEAARLILSVVITIPLALTVAPFVAASASCVDENSYSELDSEVSYANKM